MKQAGIFWFTGLSGSGKTTVAEGVRARLQAQGYAILMLDGDDVRKRLHRHLGFTEADIKENNALIAQLCREERIGYDAIFVPIISPYRQSRQAARELLGSGFFEVSFCADLQVVMSRDTKGLYAKAERQEIDNLIGYSPGTAYEPAADPDFVVDSSQEDEQGSINRFCDFVISKIGKREEFDYQQTMQRLLALPSCTLITTGRTGTDFLQSLLDSHPQVLTFNGHLQFSTFWNHSACVRKEEFRLEDLMDEFIGRHIEKFKSCYDYLERKDQLGEDFNESLDIPTDRFKHEVCTFMEGQEPNSRNVLMAIYAAYALCLGQDLATKTLFFHHEHHMETVPEYLADFPQSRLICMTRDPRANFVSGVENWWRFDLGRDHGRHVYAYIKRILADARVLEHYPNDYLVIRIEDMGREETLQELCRWLGISFHPCLRESTWGGLRWHGDRLSQKKNVEKGFSRDVIKNNWEFRLHPLEKYVYNFLMNERLKSYGYRYRQMHWYDAILAFFLIPVPLTYEIRFFSPGYLGKRLKERDFKRIASNAFYYMRRVLLFYRHFWGVLAQKSFKYPYLCAKTG